VIDDPDERKRFRKRRLGIRSFVGVRERILLEPRTSDRWDKERYFVRRSRRRFSAGVVKLESLCALLAHLSPILIDGDSRYLFGSPGGLYPVQVYLHARSVRGLHAGTYYYHPDDHSLVVLQPGADIDAGVHALENVNLAAQSSFSLFFVADMLAIEPVYGGKSRDYALLQAGLMAQLLEENARAAGLGVCQVGWLNFDLVRGLFELGARHEFLHAMVGGGLEEGETAELFPLKNGKDLFALRQQINALAPEELEQLLRALSADDDARR
jgi:SagB-type dehydrogenase family enzyme